MHSWTPAVPPWLLKKPSHGEGLLSGEATVHLET